MDKFYNTSGIREEVQQHGGSQKKESVLNLDELMSEEFNPAEQPNRRNGVKIEESPGCRKNLREQRGGFQLRNLLEKTNKGSQQWSENGLE